MKLKDKVCLITGATSGMGNAIARLFLTEGARLVLNGRDGEKGRIVAKELDELNVGNVIFRQGDISEPEVNKQLIESTVAHYGKIDTVIVNAGVLGLGSVTQLAPEDWDYTLNTNLNSLFYLAKYGLPYLKKEKGSIIANASIAAFKSFPNHPAYCASKAAAVALIKQLAIDYGPEVRANAICPGPVDTPLIWDSASAFEVPEEAVSDVANATLLKRLGKPEDIAKLALFLASEDSSWMTGTAINIDGGIMVSS